MGDLPHTVDTAELEGESQECPPMRLSEHSSHLGLLLQVKDMVNQDVSNTNTHCCVALANYSTILFPHFQNCDNDNYLYYLPYMVIARIQKDDEHQRPSPGTAT